MWTQDCTDEDWMMLWRDSYLSIRCKLPQLCCSEQVRTVLPWIALPSSAGWTAGMRTGWCFHCMLPQLCCSEQVRTVLPWIALPSSAGWTAGMRTGWCFHCMLPQLCCSEQVWTVLPWTSLHSSAGWITGSRTGWRFRETGTCPCRSAACYRHYAAVSECGQYFHEQRFICPSLTARILAASPTPSSVGVASEISLQHPSTELAQKGALLRNGQIHHLHAVMDCRIGRTGLLSLIWSMVVGCVEAIQLGSQSM